MAAYDITKLNSSVTFDSNGPTYVISLPVDSTRTINFWYDATSVHGSARIFQTNLSTGEVTPLGTQPDFSGSHRFNNVVPIDASHFLAFWTGAGDDGFCGVFEVNTSNWNVSKVSEYEFDTVFAWDITSVQMSSNKFVVSWYNDAGEKKINVFEVNTSNWNVSKVGTGTTSSDNRMSYPTILFKIDSTHFISFGTTGGLKAYARSWEVNLSTGAISGIGTPFGFHNDAASRKAISQIDSNRFIVFYAAFANMEIKVIELNSTNWSFSTLSTNSSTSITNANYTSPNVVKINSDHYLLLRGASSSVEAQVCFVNTSNWATSLGSSLQVYNSSPSGLSLSLVKLSDAIYSSVFGISSLADAITQTIKVEPPVVAPTVTTQAVSDITKDSATGNGNITATGGANATRRGFCYLQGSSGDPTTANSVVYDDGSFGTGAYTKAITGLTPNTAYRVRAYAVNSAGTSYGSTVGFTTLKADESNFFQLF